MRYLSSMLLKIIALSLLIPLKLNLSEAKTWIKAGYWYSGSAYPVPDIDSTLFTHLICAFAHINSSSYQLSIFPSDEPYFSTFTNIVKQKNPSIVTLLSIRVDDANSNFFPMVGQASRRNSFIQSSIRTARLYGFRGIDIWGVPPTMNTNMTNIGTLLDEWRAAINSEQKNSSQSRFILTMSGHYLPAIDSANYPINSIKRSIDWLHIVAYDYHLPSRENFTGAHAALYDPSSHVNTDYGIKQWIAKGLPASKMVLGLAFHGYAWLLVNPKDNRIGAPAKGYLASTEDGSKNYKYIRWYMKSYGASSAYNATYVVNYIIIESFWIGFEDVEAIRTKVSYAKDMGLLGYNVWQVPNDYNWVLSKAAQGESRRRGNKESLLVILLPTISVFTFLLCTMMWYLQRRVIKGQGKMDRGKNSSTPNCTKSASPNLQLFSFTDIKLATNNFSSEYKLGEGGYGPVYKGQLPDGQVVAVKRLSETSKQGAEEFQNEVTLTANLQHVNLLRLLGFCTEREEKLLIYEYMPNKSLDFYLYDTDRRLLLDWEKWLHIIEGVTQGLLYLQEYSRFTIVHRDLKASNILLDNEMKPKISDFGIAKIFQKDEQEANTSHIVGTYGYVPPEYVKRGIYSTKYDVYSFGVLLLQILSGKKNSNLYGLHKNLSLLEYGYEMWKDDKGKEFMDPLLDDAYSSCKLMRCMHVSLLCIQEKWQDRPSMLQVSSMLKNETEVLPTPKMPAFAINKGKEEGNCSPRQETCSVNDVTASEVVPR